MFAVDRHELATAMRGSRMHEVTGHNERLFVGEGDALSALEGRQGRVEARRTDTPLDAVLATKE